MLLVPVGREERKGASKGLVFIVLSEVGLRLRCRGNHKGMCMSLEREGYPG